MKLGLIVFVAGMCLAASVAAQSADAVAIDDARTALNAATISGDAERLGRLTSSHLSYGHGNGSVQTQDEFIAAAAARRVPIQSIKISRPVVVIDRETAVDRHAASYQVEIGGKPAIVETEVIQVWKKYEGNWKLLARQAYKLP